MRVLVTGGTGYLGRAIVRALVARGHTPIVYGRSAFDAGAGRPADDSAAGRVAFVHGDVRDRAAVIDAARGADAMIHTAAMVSVWRRRPADFDDVNVGGLRHALEAVRTHHLRRLVYTSSFLALPPAGGEAPLRGNDYQRTKAAAERVAAETHAAGTPIVRLYPGVIYGPGLLSEGNLVGRQIHDHLRGRLPGLLGADRTWSFAWVDAVADAHVTALEHPAPAPAYQLGGPNEPQRRPFDIVHGLTGRRPPRALPVWTGHVAALVDPARAALFRVPRQITQATVGIFRHDWPLDSSAAARDLGYHYPTLEEGVERIVETVRGAGAL
jgi:farnesol dehydrogenase